VHLKTPFVRAPNSMHHPWQCWIQSWKPSKPWVIQKTTKQMWFGGPQFEENLWIVLGELRFSQSPTSNEAKASMPNRSTSNSGLMPGNTPLEDPVLSRKNYIVVHGIWSNPWGKRRAPLLIRLRFACRVEIVQGVWPGVDDSRGTADCQWKLTNGPMVIVTGLFQGFLLHSSNGSLHKISVHRFNIESDNIVRTPHSYYATMELFQGSSNSWIHLRMVNCVTLGKSKQFSLSGGKYSLWLQAIINHHLQSNNHIR